MNEKKISIFHWSKEVKIAIVSLFTIALFIWVAYFLKGNNVFSKECKYYAIYSKTGGVNVAGPVIINGMKVGRISKIEFVGEKDHRIKITLSILKKYSIYENSIASLETLGLLGGSGIVIYLSDSPQRMKPETYFKTKEVPGLMEQLGPLKEKAVEMLASLDSILKSVNMVLDHHTVENLSSSFASLSVSMQNIEGITTDAKDLLRGQKHNIGDFIRNVDDISANLKSNNKQISNVIQNFSDISDTLAQANLAGTILNLNTTLFQAKQIVEKINKGEGTAGKLIYNDSLYNNIKNASQQLNFLLEDLRLNPGRYIHISVFGKKEKNKK
ncbi:MAG: MlaD family protein [Bacteroidales bacterium]